MADESKKRLGRGLAALIGEMDKPVSASAEAKESGTDRAVLVSDRVVPVESVSPNPNNPRRQFSNSDLEDLAASIREHGIVQPLLVRSSKTDGMNWELIAGERRWRAAQKAGLHEVPIIVREVDDRQALELAIIENVQRADLNPVEEAQGYQQLIDDHQYKQVDLGKVIGKSRSHVANTLRLLKLPESVLTMLTDGALSPGHARTLITLDQPEALARRIVDQGLSVREAERLAGSIGEDGSDKSKKSKPKTFQDPDSLALEKKLSDALGMKVKLAHKPNGRGRLIIDYKSLDQLDGLEVRLSQ